jgi:hypothetical protein
LKEVQEFIGDLKEKLERYNNWNYEIIKIDGITKRDNQYFWKILIKWIHIRQFLQNIKQEIFKNKDLVVIFES